MNNEEQTVTLPDGTVCRLAPIHGGQPDVLVPGIIINPTSNGWLLQIGNESYNATAMAEVIRYVTMGCERQVEAQAENTRRRATRAAG